MKPTKINTLKYLKSHRLEQTTAQSNRQKHLTLPI